MAKAFINKLKVLGIFLLMIVLVAGCTSQSNDNTNEDQEEEEVVVVETEKAVLGSINIAREYSNKLRPYKEVMIIPRMPGNAIAVHVQVGQEVSKDDLLIELDDTDIELQVAQAQAAYDVARISVDSSRDMSDRLGESKKEMESGISQLNDGIKKTEQEISNIQEEMDNLRNEMDNEEIDRDEYNESLLSLGSKLIELEFQKQMMENQRSELAGAQNAIKGNMEALPSDEMLDAQLKQAKAGLDMAKHAMNNTKIVSPIDGIVTSVTVSVGDMVNQTMPPVTVINMSSLFLDINVGEADINNIKAGEEVAIVVEALGNEIINGEIYTVSPAIDQRSQAFPVTIKLENPDMRIKPGMFARVNLIMDKRDDVVTVSKKSLVTEGNTVYVYVVNGNVVEKREIETGLDDGEKVEVQTGLKADEIIVIKGQSYLDDGKKVEVVRGEG